MAEEAGDDDFRDVRGVRTAAGHTHHSEPQQRRDTPIPTPQRKRQSRTRREREREIWRQKQWLCLENTRVWLRFITTPFHGKRVWTYHHALSF